MKGLRRHLLTAATIALALAFVAGAVYLADRHRLRWDVTAAARNTLTEASLAALAQLKGPVKALAYTPEGDARESEMRKTIADAFAPYLAAKRDFTLGFVNTEPPGATSRSGPEEGAAGVTLEYGGRRERLNALAERDVTNALIRLARGEQRLIHYVYGHGERSLEGVANHDLGDFGRQLQQKGFRLAPLNLALAQEVPDATALLVVTQPQIQMLPGETAKIRRWLDKGGNLLWLLDAEPLRGLEPIAEALGLALSPGVVIDPEARQHNAPLTMALAASYARHPALAGFQLNTVFPYARAVAATEGKGWQPTPLVEAAPRGWVETDRLQDTPAFDPKRDVPGPVVVALALQREVEDRQQRVVVVGSGSLLANTYLGNGGNLDLGVNLVNWLARDERLVAIQPRATRDASLALSRAQLTAIAVFFLLVLPVLFLAGGFLVWRRRR